MTQNVVALPGVANCVVGSEPDAGVVSVLEKYLDEARRGDAIQVLVATINAGGRISVEWAGIASESQAVAAAAILQARVNAAYLGSIE